MSKAQKILELREAIQRLSPSPPPSSRAYLETGVPALDGLLDGGLWKGGIIELSSPSLTSGLSLLMRSILQHAAAQGRRTALIDGRDCFDPQSAEADALAHLLWVRCKKATEALQATDLLIRDGNLPLLLLDLRGVPQSELRRINESRWVRLQRGIEPTSVALLALTSQPLMSCADVRLTVESQFTLGSLESEPRDLLAELSLHLTRKRASTRWLDTSIAKAS